jgi:hypothetical protein
MGKHATSVDTAVLARIREHGPGWVFTQADFADLGSRPAVATALGRHKRAGAIRQLGRGLYDVPRQSKRLGTLWPPVEAVAEAIRARDAARLQPSGAYAAHLLGITEQVPTRVTYLTDGPARSVRLGQMTITLRHTTPRYMATAGRPLGHVIQALRWIGQDKVDAAVMRRVRAALAKEDHPRLLGDLRHAPRWIADLLRKELQGLA